MEWNTTNCYGWFWGAAAILLLLFYIRRRRRIRTFLLGSISGLSSLMALHYFGDYIGFTPTLSNVNLLISAFLGIPGVMLLYLSNLLS